MPQDFSDVPKAHKISSEFSSKFQTQRTSWEYGLGTEFCPVFASFPSVLPLPRTPSCLGRRSDLRTRSQSTFKDPRGRISYLGCQAFLRGRFLFICRCTSHSNSTLSTPPPLHHAQVQTDNFSFLVFSERDRKYWLSSHWIIKAIALTTNRSNSHCYEWVKKISIPPDLTILGSAWTFWELRGLFWKSDENQPSTKYVYMYKKTHFQDVQ